ncbi:MAG: MSCRAMM family protein [Thermoanaerobaculia bacterium]
MREAAVDASGKWTFDRAASGRPYRVKLKSSLDEPWWLDDSDFTVSEPETIRKIEMDVVQVSGTARLGKQLLSGRVSFEDRGVSVSLPISREGSFAGAVPRPGAWKARVTSEVMALRRDVDVMVPRGGGEVTLEFPATAVEGEVVDENGVRVPGVSLELSRVNPPERMPWHTLDDGVIFLTELAPGEYRAFAVTLRKPYRESLVYDFVVNEDGSSEPSPLRILAPVKRALRGRVVSPEGKPLPGARIQRAYSAGNTRTHFFNDYLTDSEGRFSIDIGDDERTPCLVVQAAAHPVRILQVSDRDQEQTVVMPAAGGVLQLRAEKTLRQGPRPAGQTGKNLLRGSCIFPVPWFEILRPDATFSMINGDSYLQTPLLEPGSYTLCGLMPGEIRNFSGDRLPSSNCSTGTLVGGGRLMLEVQ